MITDNNIKRLNSIVSELAMADYKRTNPHPRLLKNGQWNHIPYTLSPNTNEAREMLQLANKVRSGKGTIQDEETVKAYLLNHRIREIRKEQ